MTMHVNRPMLLGCDLRSMGLTDKEIEPLLEAGFISVSDIASTRDPVLRINCGLSEEVITEVRKIVPYESRCAQKKRLDDWAMSSIQSKYKSLPKRLREPFKDWLASQ